MYVLVLFSLHVVGLFGSFSYGCGVGCSNCMESLVLLPLIVLLTIPNLCYTCIFTFLKKKVNIT